MWITIENKRRGLTRATQVDTLGDALAKAAEAAEDEDNSITIELDGIACVTINK